MNVNKGVWGVDIGQCALKALRLELIDGKPTATAFDYVEHTKILSQPDADPDTLIREALEKFLSRNQVKLDEVAIGIAGQSGLARFVKLPPVEEKKIAEIVKFEAKQQIPFPLDEVVWDFQKIAGGEAVDGFALETEIGLFAMKRDVISRYLGYFSASKVEVHTVQMSPLALVNFATYELLKKGGPPLAPGEGTGEDESLDDAPKGKKRCAVVMDIGTDASNLIITDGAKIIWQRPIPLGGNNFTRALTKELKLTFAKAEHLKRNAAKSPEMANILKAIKPVLTDFVGEVQRSLGYFTNTHRDAHVAYMVGLGSAFKLPGLQKYLGDKLSLEVRKPAKFARLEGESILNDPLFQENLLTFPVAYGLALQGLGQVRLTTNLLPHEIRTDRMIRAKKPYAVAAAAMLLLGTGGLALGFAGPLKSLADPNINKAIETAKSAGSAFGSQESKFTSAKSSAENTQREVKLIIAGQEERLNWPRFLEVQTAAMPHPGDPRTHPAANLTDDEQRRLWQGESEKGIAALKWFEDRMRSGVRVDQALVDDRSENPKYLAMVNVEAVNTRWVNNIGKFLEAADNQVNDTYREEIAKSMKEDEVERDEAKDRLKPKMVEGAGWVIEIRGYTDHTAGPQFVKKALIKNLQKFDAFAKNEKKVGEYIVGVQDPVKGKVSQAFIYKVWTVPDPQPNAFMWITQSPLDRLLGGASAMGGGFGPPGGGDGRGAALPPGVPPTGSGSSSGGPPGGMDPGAVVEPLGPTWSPLIAGAGTAGGPGGEGRFGSGASGGLTGGPPVGGAQPPRPGSGGGFGGIAGPGSGGPTTPGTLPAGGTGKEEKRYRYEFVVMLIWREPVLPITLDPATAPTSPGSGAPGGG